VLFAQNQTFWLMVWLGHCENALGQEHGRGTGRSCLSRFRKFQQKGLLS